MEIALMRILESLHEYLPDAKKSNVHFIEKEFVYENRYYAMKYYKCSTDGLNFFWVYNPYWIQNVIKNGSQIANRESL
jgi:hypothetical protein